jgi:hypothetical protein
LQVTANAPIESRFCERGVVIARESASWWVRLSLPAERFDDPPTSSAELTR